MITDAKFWSLITFSELLLFEIRDSMKKEAERAVNLALTNAAREKKEAIAATKEKQWCAYCKKEAMFYCCWNTSYCDYSCQVCIWLLLSSL